MTSDTQEWTKAYGEAIHQRITEGGGIHQAEYQQTVMCGPTFSDVKGVMEKYVLEGLYLTVGKAEMVPLIVIGPEWFTEPVPNFDLKFRIAPSIEQKLRPGLPRLGELGVVRMRAYCVPLIDLPIPTKMLIARPL